MKKRDFILLGFICLFIGLIICLTRINNQKERYAYVYHYDDLIMKIDLNVDKKYSILDGEVVLLVSKGKIGVLESDCKDHLCEDMGMTNTSGHPIICVPNGLSIIVSGESRDVIVG